MKPCLRFAASGLAAGLLLLVCAGTGGARPEAAEDAPAVRAVEAIGMTVADMDRSLDFYTRVLPFRKVSDVEVAGEEFERLEGLFGVRMRVVRLALGAEFLELMEYLAPTGRPFPADSRSNDRIFQHAAIVVSDIDRAYRQLREHRVQHASTGPQRLPDWNPNAGGIQAFYFRDPDGHYLELIQFPEGKGDPRWHDRQLRGRLFLGIDHTAIVVSNTETSLRFYRDLLGMGVAGESENYGTEQEHLNNVAGARLRITGLRAGPPGSSGTGPGIEFLEYLQPRDGRPSPADSRANDLWHWQTTLVTDRARETASRLRGAHALFLSPDVIPLATAVLGFRQGAQVADPDGHSLLLVQR